MTITEPADSIKPYLITIDQFQTCLIDGKTRREICSMYPGANVYYLRRFDRYLQEHHGMDIKEYVIKHGGVTWPKCPESGRDVGYGTGCGAGLIIRRYAHHAGVSARTSVKVRENAERMKVTRRGEGNPMCGKAAWNKGLTAETDATMAAMAEKRVGWKASEETRAKQRAARARHPLKARHAMPHTHESRQKMRVSTARRWATGGFSQGNTSIHQAMRSFLQSLPLTERFVEEYQEQFYSLDFAFPRARVAVECDGDYFHTNPAFYPDGPRTSVQRRNAVRDGHRNHELAEWGWMVIHVWESEINAGNFKEPLQCRLSELGLLNPSVGNAA